MIENGHITNPEILKVGDAILFVGNDPDRPRQIGHVEYVYEIKASAPSPRGKITVEVDEVFKGCPDSSSVYVLRTLLRGRGMTGADGKILTVEFKCDDDTVSAINKYETIRRRGGVELGTNGANDGHAGKRFWNDILGGLVK